MSWIVSDLWRTLEFRREEYDRLLKENGIKAFEIINRLAAEVGARWGTFLQLNFPPGQENATQPGLGHRNLTMLVYRDRKKFDPVSESDVKKAFAPLNPLSFDSAGFRYEGFRVRLPTGRIDCLPGGVHLWCEITPDVLRVLDWLFPNAYGIKPSDNYRV